MTAQSKIRIEIVKVEDRPGPFHWELYKDAETKPFLISRGTFRSARSAYADAQAVLDRHRKRQKPS